MGHRLFKLLLVGAVCTATVGIVPFATNAAGHRVVVISEIQYHPASDDDADEFVELHNPGGTAVDIGDWCFTAGISYCFAAGRMIDPGGHLVLAPDTVRFQAKYGFEPAGVYSGKLSNSGESVLLVDQTGAVADGLTYSDHDPWPTTPDGVGSSLERIDAHEDGDTPRNWRGSTAAAGHTAGLPNSAGGTGLPPIFTEVTYGRLPSPGAPIGVTARLEGAGEAQIVYKVDFGAEVVRSMSDDGASGDGAAGDGVFGASIPGQVAGQLVRFRLVASNGSGTMSFPRSDDTITYVGTTVAESVLVTDLPVFQWFITPTDYAEALAHRYTDETEPAVFAYAGEIIDGTRVRVRGQSSRSWSKPNWNFEFPQGHDFAAPGLLEGPVDSMNLQSGYSDKTYLREQLAWDSYAAAGVPAAQAFHTRVEQNNEFFGLFTYVEQPDGNWRSRMGIDGEGAQYKASDDGRYRGGESALHSRYEKKTRLNEDYSDLDAFLYNVNYLTGTGRHQYLMDNLDIPGIINYLAVQNLIHNNDAVAKNYYLYRDTEGTGRWTMFPWDLDLTFGRNYNGAVLNDVIWADTDSISGRTNVSPSHPLFGNATHQKYDYLWNRVVDSVFADEELRSMFFRRLRTVADELLAGTYYEDRIDAEVARIAPEAAMDKARWGQYGTAQDLPTAVTALKTQFLDKRRPHLFVTHAVTGEIPAAQSPSPTIVISEIGYNPLAGGGAEFVELYNPSGSDVVDVSGWQLDGADLVVPPGTVILPGHYAVFVESDADFRSYYGSGRFVAGEYEGGLSNSGEALTLLDGEGSVVDAVAYDDVAPWPTAPDGFGPTLELVDSSSDNSLAVSWAPSSAVGGSPGLPNAASVGLPVDLHVNEVAPVGSAEVLDEAGDADPWLEIFNGGDSALNLGGMYLGTSGGGAMEWQVPVGTSLCGGCHLVAWADGETSEGPMHAAITLPPGGGSALLSMSSGAVVDGLAFPALDAGDSYGSAPSGSQYQEALASVTPGAQNPGPQPKVILNEYNAVSSSKMLGNSASDPFWGRVLGNGGDWFELVVVSDHVDLRGWDLVVRDQAGLAGETVTRLTFSEDAALADLRAGSIVTVSEDLADDASYDPSAGDWWVNVRASASGTGQLISATGFDVSNDSWQLTIEDADGRSVFGPAGEGVNPASGIGSDEVFKLEEDPSLLVSPQSAYKDGTSSTFGEANRYAAGTIVQDLSALRAAASPPTAPTELAVAGVTGSSVELAWTESTDNTGVAGYRVYRDGAEVGTTSTAQFTDTGLDDHTTYAYSVRAYDVDANESHISGEVPATTSDVTPPQAPQALRVDAVTEASVTLSWDTAIDNVGVAGYRVYRDGALIEDGVTSDPGFTDTDTDLLPARTYSYAVVAFDAAGNASSLSDPVTATTLGVFEAPTSLIAEHSTWRYLDNGTNQGIAWRASGFNDVAWSTGAGQLGYGEGDEVTVVSFGPVPAKKYVTTYFRKVIDVPDPSSFDYLYFGLLRDDGAVVYVNGVEVVRSNMPTGSIGHKTAPSVNVGGADEYTYFQYTVPSGALVAGTNVIAVEVHQKGWTNNDLSFDLRLDGINRIVDAEPPGVPTGLTKVRTLNNLVRFRWTAPTDNFGIARYEILRDGVLIGTSAVADYKDRTVAPSSMYSYRVVAVDLGGNRSAPSSAYVVSTPA